MLKKHDLKARPTQFKLPTVNSGSIRKTYSLRSDVAGFV